MPSLGPLELIIILVIIVVIFGVGRLPEIGGAIGRSIREFKTSVKDEDDVLTDVGGGDAGGAAGAGLLDANQGVVTDVFKGQTSQSAVHIDALVDGGHGAVGVRQYSVGLVDRTIARIVAIRTHVDR